MDPNVPEDEDLLQNDKSEKIEENIQNNECKGSQSTDDFENISEIISNKDQTFEGKINETEENLTSKNGEKNIAVDSSIDRGNNHEKGGRNVINLDKETKKKLIKAMSVSRNEDIDEEDGVEMEPLTIVKKNIQQNLSIEGGISIESDFESEEDDFDESSEVEIDTEIVETAEAKKIQKSMTCIYCYKKGVKGRKMKAMEGWEETIDGQALVVYKCHDCLSMILK